LRSIAIISVIIAHTYRFNFAASGVQIFFFISGYLIINLRQKLSARAFIIYRAARLFPLAIIMTIIFSFRFENLLEFVANIFLVQTLIPNSNSFPGGWSISYEWLFSIILIPPLLFNRRITRLIILNISILFMIISDVLFYLNSRESSLSVVQNTFNFLGNITFLYLGICIARNDFKLPKINRFILFGVLGLIGILSRNEIQLLTVWFIYLISIILIIFQANFLLFIMAFLNFLNFIALTFSFL
jgi:peptidoglycan/LPS O-acetylase OafA/YrhL